MNEKEMWLKLVCAGAAGYEVPTDFDGDTDDLIDDIADVAEGFASEMLDRFEEKFGPIQEDGRVRGPAKRKRGGGGRGRGRRGEPTPAED
jgi:hypothetical protein